MSGCDDWNEIDEWGKTNVDWLGTFLELPNGILSHDTINRVFSLIDPKEFQLNFIERANSIATNSDGRIIAIDGKRLCNSGTDGKKNLVHMVSAWSSENGLVLGQIKTEEKSNEITAIPCLLELINMEGAVITIDAMGCQKAIASKIIEKKGDYVLALKENQPGLNKVVKNAFADLAATSDRSSATSTSGTFELGHGRIEKRTCTVIGDLNSINPKINTWENLRSFVQISSERTDKKTGIKQTEERYYISSLNSDATRFNEIIRGHWEIENNLHWQLDVLFKEDMGTKQAGNAAENFSTVTRVALNMLKKDKIKKTSIKIKRKLCGWDKEYLGEILFG